MEHKTFEINRNDWSQYSGAKKDEKAYDQIVQDFLKENPGEILCSEDILVEGHGKVTIEIKSEEVSLPRIRYYEKKRKGAMDYGKLKGAGAGKEPGVDYIDHEVKIDEVEAFLFDELELPNLKKEIGGLVTELSEEYKTIATIGPLSTIHKRHTFRASMKRHALSGKRGFTGFEAGDLRFRATEEVKKEDNTAVVFAMMDTSGSMGYWEKFMSRTFFFWTKKFLETKYEHVEIVYISHHTEAKEVDKDAFFEKGESGGTICSSAYKKMIEIMDERYTNHQNVYAYYVSDGDNLTSDNARSLKLIQDLLPRIRQFGYMEVNQYNRHSTLIQMMKNCQGIQYTIVNNKDGLYKTMKNFFGKENAQ